MRLARLNAERITGKGHLAVLKIEDGTETRKNKKVEAFEAVSANVVPGMIYYFEWSD